MGHRSYTNLTEQDCQQTKTPSEPSFGEQQTLLVRMTHWRTESSALFIPRHSGSFLLHLEPCICLCLSLTLDLSLGVSTCRSARACPHAARTGLQQHSLRMDSMGAYSVDSLREDGDDSPTRSCPLFVHGSPKRIILSFQTIYPFSKKPQTNDWQQLGPY
jgi:hypothetical protein